MKRRNRQPLPAYVQILQQHGINQPIKDKKSLLRLFSGRTNSTLQINEVIDTTKLLIAIRQSAAKKKKVPG